MKTYRLFVCAAIALALGAAACAEEYQLLRTKAELLVDQAKEFYADSCKKGNELHTPQYQYYFLLISSTGTNLLARSKSQKNERRLTQYCEMIGKDYDAYTKCETAMEMAGATGGSSRRRSKSDARHRAKRLINAEKLGEKELVSAIGRWEKFIVDIQKDPKDPVKVKPTKQAKPEPVSTDGLEAPKAK